MFGSCSGASSTFALGAGIFITTGSSASAILIKATCVSSSLPLNILAYFLNTDALPMPSSAAFFALLIAIPRCPPRLICLAAALRLISCSIIGLRVARISCLTGSASCSIPASCADCCKSLPPSIVPRCTSCCPSALLGRICPSSLRTVSA